MFYYSAPALAGMDVLEAEEGGGGFSPNLDRFHGGAG
jgi:hypothetical protein